MNTLDGFPIVGWCNETCTVYFESKVQNCFWAYTLNYSVEKGIGYREVEADEIQAVLARQAVQPGPVTGWTITKTGPVKRCKADKTEYNANIGDTELITLTVTDYNNGKASIDIRSVTFCPSSDTGPALARLIEALQAMQARARADKTVTE